MPINRAHYALCTYFCSYARLASYECVGKGRQQHMSKLHNTDADARRAWDTCTCVRAL